MTTAQDEMIERIGGYIRHNAEKEPAAIRSLVQEANERLAGLLDGMSEGQAAFKPAPDVWSVVELMAHVVTAKHGVARICERLARGEQVANFGVEGEEQNGVTRGAFASLSDARPAAQSAHDELLAFIDGLSGGENVDARYKHFLFGELNCREWAVFQRVHDFDHSNQIEQILAAPGYPA